MFQVKSINTIIIEDNIPKLSVDDFLSCRQEKRRWAVASYYYRIIFDSRLEFAKHLVVQYSYTACKVGQTRSAMHLTYANFLWWFIQPTWDTLSTFQFSSQDNFIIILNLKTDLWWECIEYCMLQAEHYAMLAEQGLLASKREAATLTGNNTY